MAKAKLLFNRIDTANLTEEMRLTDSNLRALCTDLELEMSDEDIKGALTEMDR